MAQVEDINGSKTHASASNSNVDRKTFSFSINPGTLTTYTSIGGKASTHIIPTTKSSYKATNMKLDYYKKDKSSMYLKINVYLQKRLKDNFGLSVTIGHWVLVDGTCIKINTSKPPASSYAASSGTTESQAKGNSGTGGVNTGTKYNSSSKNNTSSGGDTGDESVAGTEEESNIVSAKFDPLNGLNAVNLKSNSTLDDLMAKSMHGIFGIPYQWMAIADRRIGDSEFGRKYAEKIAARMPLLFLTPCRPSFMDGATKDQKSNLISALFDNSDGKAKLIDTLLGDSDNTGVTKFYTADFAYEEYYRYVDVCCQTTAKLMHLDGSKGSPTKEHGVKILGDTGKKSIREFHRFNWSKALSGEFTKYFSAASAIPFYINANVSVSESISNDTTESALAGTVKSKEESAKELQYLLNTASSASSSGGVVGKAVNNTVDLVSGAINGLASKSTASNFLSSVRSSMSSIAAGGSMMFPELWSSSSMGRSYQIDIKLRSPDGDALSVYLNVLVPLYHLLCLAAPQMMNDNYNVYFSPFLVKAYCKSMFNIDMGIITSMDISKGKEGDWNANGVPTSIDVSLTIKDLYDVFSLTPYNSGIDLQNPLFDGFTKKKDASSAKKIVRNTAMMDYLCNNAGLNLNQNELGRQVTVYQLLRTNSITNWPNNKWLKLQQTVDNKLANIYRPSANNR